MDKSKRDLDALVTTQKEQLTRYETRLKDVVTAYKGLLKEKEALEASLSALTSSAKNKSDKDGSESDSNNVHKAATVVSSPPSDDLQLQLATLMNSLATLSAEKSRMEASFQADKKQLRTEMQHKEKLIKELQDKIRELKERSAVDLDNMKSKIIVERHEREKETNNHMVMIRELQKLFSDERHLKENLEMQLNDLKSQFTAASNSDGRIQSFMAELNQTKEKLRQYEGKRVDPSNGNVGILQQLQTEMQHLKQQHAIAIKTEQKRALTAEERNKKLAALHEDRVANLESRLVELSNSVGNYDRLQKQDQESIQKLKEKIIQLASGVAEPPSNLKKPQQKDLTSIIEEIAQLKKILLVENARSDNPIDLNKIFNTGTDHTQCLEDIQKIQSELQTTKVENGELKQSVETQRNHIKTLQDKVKVLNRNIDEQELELKTQTEKVNVVFKAEKSKWKEILNGLESDYRSKISTLEHQLQKQRDRSLQLLEEKENEIKTLKTSLEIIPTQMTNIRREDDEGVGGSLKPVHLGVMLNTNHHGGSSVAGTTGDNCPMLHYVHEIARRDVEITSLRRAKHSAETSLRQALQDKVTAQEDLNETIQRLENEVDRLERCKTREGANLEYLKNVILSFLFSTDVDGKKHMINAIGAVLQFNPSELNAINNLFHKK